VIGKWFDWSYIRKVIIKATSALGHSSPKREQCDAVEQFVSGHNVFMFAYYIPHPD
jgi:hypothetical protein